jgi:serine/threonine protein phosphatase 1
VYLQEDAYDRVVAIGDLHGHLNPLKEMLKRVDPKPSDCLLFIGDYVDRGPESKDLVQELIDLRFSLQNLVFLKGNHEDMLLGSLGFPALVTDLDTWLYNGGAATLHSYGAGTGEIDHALAIRDNEERASFLRKQLPQAHVDFFLSLEMYVESEHFFFCHGGVDPRKSLEEGKDSVYHLLWMREHLYADDPVWEKTVVCGHTPLRSPLLSPKLIGIDTGFHYFGTLTAVEVLSREVFQVSW